MYGNNFFDPFNFWADLFDEVERRTNRPLLASSAVDNTSSCPLVVANDDEETFKREYFRGYNPTNKNTKVTVKDDNGVSFITVSLDEKTENGETHLSSSETLPINLDLTTLDANVEDGVLVVTGRFLLPDTEEAEEEVDTKSVKIDFE